MTAPPYTGQALRDPFRLAALAGSGLTESGPDASFDRLTHLAARALNAPVAVVALVDAHRLYFKSQVGLAAEWDESREIPVDDSVRAPVVVSSQPLVVVDTQADDRNWLNAAVHEMSARSYMGVPLLSSDGHILGTFCVLDMSPREWTDDERSLVADIAAAVTAEIHLREAVVRATTAAADARRAERRLALVNSVTTALSETLDLGTALDRLSRLLVPALADLCAVELFGFLRGISPGLLVVHSADPEAARLLDLAQQIRPRAQAPNSLAYQAVTERRARMVTEVDDAHLRRISVDDTQLDLYRRLQLVSMVSVPLAGRGEPLGVLTFANTTRSGRRYGADDLELISDIGSRASVAIDNARLYTTEHMRATSLQRSLLPEVPDIEALDVCAVYLPGRKDADVGGDWYDVFELPDGGISLTIGDVMGHDITAAAAMGQLRSVVRVCAWQGAGPARVLSELDQLVDHFHQADLATVVHGTLTLEPDGSGRLVVANAGHPPPLLVGADGARYLEGMPSPLIGAVDNPQRDEQTTALTPGWTLILYTDGLVESVDLPLGEGLARLSQLAATTAGLGASEVCSVIGSTIGESDDDIALLVVRSAGDRPPSQ
ncbi:MAG TPA: SpoIIE family protein phosphatase [Acidimicrobiales bacterium]|nr:SpoIIE family protein phosphatase [Acidimicrobiales bacterium]